LQPDDPYQTGRRLDRERPAPGEEGWSFAFPIYVRLNDLDAFGHVNNTVYLTYCEMARTAYLHMATGISGPQQMHMILARAEVDFRTAIEFGDLLRVLVRAGAVGTKSFTLEYKMLITRDSRERIACESSSVLVGYDYTALHSVALAPEFVAALEAFEGRRLRS
jgi:acyl-CoA thioester hydrolase